MGTENSNGHSAEGAALGFYYQSLYALLAVLELPHDDAAVVLERLDDVQLTVDGGTLLTQLKHSIATKPPTVTLASRQLWDTLKVWIDTLPFIVLAETQFRLITVGSIDSAGDLRPLCSPGTDRSTFASLLIAEAQRVVNEHQEAKSKGCSSLPHKERVKSCQAFLDMDSKIRSELIARILVKADTPNICNINCEVEKELVNFPPDKRPLIAERLIQWWDMQVVYSLCGKRERCLRKLEILQKIAEISGEIERDELIPDFESIHPPKNHTPDSMLERQIQLVNGSRNDLRIAIREEWRARSQRHKWVSGRIDIASRITAYDTILKENWDDKHNEICEDIDETMPESELVTKGHQVLKWALNDAERSIRPLAPNWNYPYYIRGSLQILSINLEVGWHPNFKQILDPDL